MSQLDSYIAIEGPIGVGKTSLGEMIAEKLNARKVFEDTNVLIDEAISNINKKRTRGGDEPTEF